MDFCREKGRFAVLGQREDFFDTIKPRDNFAIGEIIEEKASLFMVFNLGSAFSALPYRQRVVGIHCLVVTRSTNIRLTSISPLQQKKYYVFKIVFHTVWKKCVYKTLFPHTDVKITRFSTLLCAQPCG